MWGIAAKQGIRLPTKDYWEFVDLITVGKRERKSFEDFLALYRWTELIQSSPLAVEESVYEVVGGAYRKANITTLELRYNPMKRNRGGEQDLDHIIMASIRGLDRARLEYPVRAGLIFCLDRTFTYALNEIIVEKAIAYRHRGVLGIDIAGPTHADFQYRDYAALFKKARSAGLGLTVHAGEDEDWHSVDEVLQHLEPERIGHGIHAAENAALCKRLSERGVLLEICPSSNIHTQVVTDAEELGRFIATFKKHKVRFSFNTDGPEMLQTTLRDELRFAVRSGWVSKEELVSVRRMGTAGLVRAARFDVMTRSQAAILRFVLICAAWAVGQTLTFGLLDIGPFGVIIPAALAIGVLIVTEDLGARAPDRREHQVLAGTAHRRRRAPRALELALSDDGPSFRTGHRSLVKCGCDQPPPPGWTTPLTVRRYVAYWLLVSVGSS